MYNVTELTDYFGYLDYLRESGQTGMLGAGPYLMAEYGISKKQAFDVLATWMSTFDHETGPAERAEQAVKDNE